MARRYREVLEKNKALAKEMEAIRNEAMSSSELGDPDAASGAPAPEGSNTPVCPVCTMTMMGSSSSKSIKIATLEARVAELTAQITTNSEDGATSESSGNASPSSSTLLSESSAESCWMRLPSGCNRGLSETSTPTEWFIDPSNGASATSCSASRLVAFNSHCARSDAENHWGTTAPPAGVSPCVGSEYQL